MIWQDWTLRVVAVGSVSLSIYIFALCRRESRGTKEKELDKAWREKLVDQYDEVLGLQRSLRTGENLAEPRFLSGTLEFTDYLQTQCADRVERNHLGDLHVSLFKLAFCWEKVLRNRRGPASTGFGDLRIGYQIPSESCALEQPADRQSGRGRPDPAWSELGEAANVAQKAVEYSVAQLNEKEFGQWTKHRRSIPPASDFFGHADRYD